MNALMEKFGGPRKDGCGFTILGFPCNQFGKQEPGETPDEILNGLKYVRPGKGFEAAFPLLEKVDVNGAKQHQMFTYLKEHCPLPGGVIMKKAQAIIWEPVRSDDLNWNFSKFLIDHNGKPVKRFLPSVSPLELNADIERLLSECAAKRRREWRPNEDYDDSYEEY